jgi:hypothetical protein
VKTLRLICAASTAMPVVLVSALAAAAGLTMELPQETAELQPGPGSEAVAGNCLACHSADYISTQPSNFSRDFWKAEVLKMKNVYGAPIAESDVRTLTEYLAKNYGNEKPK